MKYDVIIPAAGQGSRMKAGYNKQFIKLADRPLIVHTVAVFEEDPWCERVILVANEKECDAMSALMKEWQMMKVRAIVPGGKERQDSVLEGLKRAEAAIVLIHDGARPFVAKESIHELVRTAADKGSAVLAVPVKDTIKEVNNGFITNTPERTALWAAQTPQAFQKDLIVKAYEKATSEQFRGTDDASLVEKCGKKVHIVEGSDENIKLTTPLDIDIAHMILKKRKKGEKS